MDLDGTALELKAQVTEGVLEAGQALRGEIAELQKGKGVNLADTYLQGLDLEASTGVSRGAASNLLKLALKVATSGLGEKQPAEHGECHDAGGR